MIVLIVALGIASLAIGSLGAVFACHFPVRALVAGCIIAVLLLLFFNYLAPGGEIAFAALGVVYIGLALPAASFLAGSLIGWIIFACRFWRRRRAAKKVSIQF